MVPVSSRENGVEQLEARTIDAFAGDRVLLLGVAAKAKNPAATALLADALSCEPYAIALPRGDWALQQAVDAGLARVLASAELPTIYQRWFAGLGEPSLAMVIVDGLGRPPQ